MDPAPAITIWLLATAAAVIMYVYIHELGHAVAALIFTQGDVHICIGPVTNYDQLPKLRLKRLNIACARNPLLWYRGSFTSDPEEISLKRRILIIVAGPAVAFVIGALMWYLTPERSSVLMLDTFVSQFAYFGIGGVIALIPVRLRPRHRSTNPTSRDGALIADLLRHRNYHSVWTTAMVHCHHERYAAAATVFEEMIQHHTQDEDTYWYAISAHLLARNYQRAYELYMEFENLYTMTPLDLNNRGYVLNVLGRYAEAIEDFDRVIAKDPRFAFAYNNRGFAKIAMGLLEDGRQDIEHSLKLDGRNSYAFRNLGIYHLERGELSHALELFEKARSIDPSTDEVDDYIVRARAMMME